MSVVRPLAEARTVAQDHDEGAAAQNVDMKSFYIVSIPGILPNSQVSILYYT